jgi:uncharacterized membrane protein
MRSNLNILSYSWDTLRSKWLLAIGLNLLHVAVSSVVGMVGMGIGNVALGGALTFGFNRAMIQIYRGQSPAIDTYFDGFRVYLPTLITFLLTAAIVVAGFVLLVIPGVIAAIGLSQVFYVLQDQPELGAEAAVRESWRLTWTNGKMWKVFGMMLLSVLVGLGGLLAFGVGLLFAIPLISVMTAGLYEELRLSESQIGPVESV